MKKIILIQIYLVTHFLCFSQNNYFNIRYPFSSTSWDGALSIVTVPDGYIILGGTADTIYNNFQYCAILKIDLLGNVLWKKQYGEIMKNYYAGATNSIVPTYDGNFAFGGSIEDSTLDDRGLLIKFDGNGDTLWTKTFGGVGYETIFYQCKASFDSGFMLIGVTTKTDTDGDIILVKTDPSGNLQWEKTYGGGGVEYGLTVIVTSDGGYLLSGHTDSFGAGANDAYVIKTDNTGNVQWDTTYGTVNGDCAYGFIQTSDDNYIGCGCEFDTFLSGSYYQSFPSLLKIDNTGKVLWKKKYSPSRYIAALEVINELPDGNFVTIGQSNNNKGTPNGNGWAIGVILKVNAQGDSIWYREFEYDTCEKNFDYFRDMKPTSDGGFIVAGFFTPNTSFQCNDTGTQDMWVIKLDSCGCAWLGCDSACQGLLGSDELRVEKEGWIIFPNPTDGKFEIEIPSPKSQTPNSKEECIEIKIFDILGKNILRMKIVKEKAEVDISGFDDGLYLIQIRNENSYYTARVVKY